MEERPCEMKKEYFINIPGKLVEIFQDHCNLSCEEFEELRSRLDNLMFMIQDDEKEEAKKEAEALIVIVDWLYNVKELTLKEHYELGELIEDMNEESQKEAGA